MFSVQVKNSKGFRNCIKAVSQLIDEATITINPEGLVVRTMDLSQIAMIDLRIPSSAFENYGTPAVIDVGVDFSELEKVMKRLKPNDAIKIGVDTKVTIELIGDSTRKFSYGIIDSKTTPPKEPKIEFTAEAEILGGTLQEALKDADLISTHVATSFTAEQTLKIIANGDTGTADIDFKTETLKSIKVTEAAKATFASNMLGKMVASAELDTPIKISLKNNTPIKIEYKMGDAEIRYYLAPRIESV
jgi:proliferating cell nuclear antigen